MSQPLKNEKVAQGGSLTELKPEIEQEARDFLSETLGRQITGDFGAILKDGTLLCEYVSSELFDDFSRDLFVGLSTSCLRKPM
jgi:hypothetical protein